MKSFVYLADMDGFSGITGPILQEMSQYYSLTKVIDPFGLSRPRDLIYRLITVRPGYYRWRAEYYRLSGKYLLSDRAFRKRTASCGKSLRSITQNFDFIFQLSHMLYPPCSPDIPVYIYTDRTSRLRRRLYGEDTDIKGAASWDELTTEAFQRCRRIFTFNEITRESVIHDYGIDSSKVVSVGSGMNIDIPVFDKNYDSSQVIFVGADFHRHGGETALSVMRMLHQVRPEVSMICIGKYLGAEYPFITSYKHVDHNTLQTLLRDSAVLIMPSLMGGMQTIAEAMASKCVPVVADRNPYVHDVIDHGISGIFVQRDDPGDWADAIVKVLDQKEYRVNLMDGCSNAATERLTWRNAILRIRDEIQATLWCGAK